MNKKFKALSGKEMIALTREVILGSGALDQRIQESEMYKHKKAKDLPSLVLISLPEATAISIIDLFFTNKINYPDLNDKDILDKIIYLRASLSFFKTRKKLKALLEKRFISVEELIEAIVKIEHKISLSDESVKDLISEYIKVRKLKQKL